MPGHSFTDRQGQYLAFIDAYTRVHGRPPAETDMQRHFQVTPPSVHQMILTLERAGLIRRQPGVARSIEVLVAPPLPYSFLRHPVSGRDPQKGDDDDRDDEGCDRSGPWWAHVAPAQA